MSDFNSLPLETSPMLSDFLFAARGSAFGAERKTALSSVQTLLFGTAGGVASGKVFVVNNSLTLSGTDGKALTLSNSLTFAGTDGSTLNIGTGGTLGTAAYVALTTLLQKANNLSDLASTSTARTNLGLGGAAVLNVGTTAGTVCAGNDSRLSDARQCNNTFANAITSRTNLGLATVAATGAYSDLSGKPTIPTVNFGNIVVLMMVNGPMSGDPAYVDVDISGYGFGSVPSGVHGINSDASVVCMYDWDYSTSTTARAVYKNLAGPIVGGTYRSAFVLAY